MEVEVSEQAVDAVRRKSISESSRAAYTHNAALLLLWLRKHGSASVNLAFGVNEEGEATLASLKEALCKPSHGVLPIDFEHFSVKEFVMWILSCRKKDGTRPSFSVLNSKRAALFHLCREYGKTFSPAFSQQLKEHMKSVARTCAEEKGGGIGRIQEGKDAMTFSLYRWICAKLLQEFDPFAFLFATLTWNLMCCAASTNMIKFSHLEWQEDALGIYFAHQKNDQRSERPKDARKVYANPLLPEVCPILALGIYLMCYPQVCTTDKLFQGNDQHKRFSKLLERLVTSRREDMTMAPTTCNIGTHSFRNGASTYASGGSTACPSATAVHLRAGWSLGRVQDTCLRFDQAGDAHVGRTVCGLPRGKADFALLPPHFDNNEPDFVSRVQKENMPQLSESMSTIGRMALASVVFHHSWLLQSLPAQHALRFTPLFRSEDQVVKLKDHLICGTESHLMSATGVPPHTSILLEMAAISSEIKEILPQIRESVPRVVEGVTEVVEERSIQANTVTRDGLVQLLEQVIDSRLPQLQGGQNSESDAPRRIQNVHEWGGQLHRVPEDFNVPCVSVMSAWQLWWRGGDNHPPLRGLSGRDMSTATKRKRLGELRYLMRILEKEAENKGIQLTTESSLEDVNAAFKAVCAILQTETAVGRKRKRDAHTKWATAARELRKRRRVAYD